MSFTRLRFRSSGKSSRASGLSQSLDAGDTSELGDDSFDEIKPVKRTTSAPSREGSATPPSELPPPPPSGLSSSIPHSPTILEEPVQVAEVKASPHQAHICVMLEQDVCDRVVLNQDRPKKPNGSTATTPPTTSTTTTTAVTAPSKLQGIVQPLRPSTSSGWLWKSSLFCVTLFQKSLFCTLDDTTRIHLL